MEEPTVLGKIIGKSTTRAFSFAIENESKVFEYLKVHHRIYGDVLCQITEITATVDERTALCSIIGFRDKEGAIKTIRVPLDVGSHVLRADDDFIRSIIHLEDQHGALVGRLEGRDIGVHLDLRKILTKHVAVLAKSGAGKSYTVGVLIEEILEKGVPLVIIDPHGEYGTLSQLNTSRDDVQKLATFNMLPKNYAVNEYGDPAVTSGKPLKLTSKMTQQELVQMIPTKLTTTQIGILYSALRNIGQINFDTVIASLNAEESNAKWGLINILEHLRTYNIFSSDPTPYDEIVSPGVCSVINLRGIPAEIQSILVYKLTKDLFDLRKRGAIPPFFLVLEEAHNFCPERSFGETTASKTIRTIAAEGRKFGLGLCAISQRPARIDKSVVSQCSTQIILKVTNPNDLKAISASVEGLTSETEKEIANLPIGTALITGIVEVPLLVNIRPRKTLHGGHSVDIFTEIQEASKRTRKRSGEVKPEQKAVAPPQDQKPNDQGLVFATVNLLQPIAVLKPKKGIMEQLLKEKPLSKVEQTLLPVYLVSCSQGAEEFKLIVERVEGTIVTSIDTGATKRIPDLKHLTKDELKILQEAYVQKMLNLSKEKLQDPAVHSLVQKGYLLMEPSGLTLSEKYLFQKLSKVKSEDEIELQKITGATARTPVLGEGDVRTLLSPFVNVKALQECYVLRISVA